MDDMWGGGNLGVNMKSANNDIPITLGGFFFGWVVVGASAVGLFLGLSSYIGVAFGLFIKPLEQEFGWSRTEISLGLTIATVTILLISPLLGGLVDRFGVRRFLLGSIAALGVSVIGMALLTSSILHFYFMYLLIPIAGAGTLPTTYTRVLLNWFDRRRGIALGIALAGIGLAGVIGPPVLQALIANFSWRDAYLFLGLTMLLVGFPVILFLFPVYPSEKGLYKDGASVEAAFEHNGSSIGMDAGAAFRSRSFMLMAGAFALLGLAGTGLIAHLMPLLTDRGMPPSAAAGVVAVFGASVIFSRIACGLLIDRFFAPHVAFFFLAGPAIGLLLLGLNESAAVAILASVLLGLGLGAEFDFMSYLISKYLGLKSYGQIYGVMYSAFLAGGSFGPLLMGRSYDLTGQYGAALFFLSGAAAIAVFLIQFLGPYPDLRKLSEEHVGR